MALLFHKQKDSGEHRAPLVIPDARRKTRNPFQPSRYGNSSHLAGANQRLADTILGHTPEAMGSIYFSGFSLKDLAGALEKVAISA